MRNHNINLEIMLIEMNCNMERILEETIDELAIINVEYEDKLRDMNLVYRLKNRLEVLTTLVKMLDHIELAAIEMHNDEVMMKCENRKAKVINHMNYINQNYML